jgi:hypothetical protein
MRMFVGIVGIEPTTFRVSDECSNQLSYIPICVGEAGFEPTTSWSQTMHTTGLYYSPLCCGGRTRTAELERGEIYSLLSLPLDYTTILRFFLGSNQGPND